MKGVDFMSDEERAIKKLELKNILMSVPIKAIISGIITYAVLFVLVFAVAALKLPDAIMTIFGLLFIFGGFALDVMRIIKYIRLSGKKSNNNETQPIEGSIENQ